MRWGRMDSRQRGTLWVTNRPTATVQTHGRVGCAQTAASWIERQRPGAAGSEISKGQAG